MPVVGMKIDSVDAKRGKEVSMGQVRVNSTPKVTSVKEIDLKSLNKKALALGFEFTTKYEPEVAEIKIGGEVLYLSPKNAQILKKWKSKKALPDDVNVEVLNHLFRQCLLKVSNIADDLQLPPPIAMPVVRPKGEQEASGYVG